MDCANLHETKIHGSPAFPYSVYHGRIPEWLSSFPLHWHESFELIYCHRGRLTASLWGQSYTLCAGDLLVVVAVTPDPRFERDGSDLYTVHTVSFTQATLGSEIQIEGIDGAIKYSLPAGTQPGSRITLRGKGAPSVSGRGRGDLIVTIQVQVPTNLTGQQKDALLAYAEAMGEGDSHAPTPVKDFFKKKKK